MTAPLKSLIACGTKLWLDSIDPELVKQNRADGATGATSNPAIVSALIGTGRFDDTITKYIDQGLNDHDIAWKMNDELVADAQKVFLPVWEETKGNDGYVSFEIDPLLEDPDANMPHAQRVEQYVELGKKYAQGYSNRMIKVPATPAGLDALAPLCAAGITLNVTLIFTMRQYEAAQQAVWKGAQQRKDLNAFKSVYSIFVSRVDVYTEQKVPELSPAAQGLVGIVNAKQLWQANTKFWKQQNCPLQQEIIFASTGTKDPKLPPWKYVAALAGSDIQTNPPETNEAVAKSTQTFTRTVDQMPPDEVVQEIAAKVDPVKLENTLMEEGIKKFAVPQKKLLETIANKRKELVAK